VGNAQGRRGILGEKDIELATQTINSSPIVKKKNNEHKQGAFFSADRGKICLFSTFDGQCEVLILLGSATSSDHF